MHEPREHIGPITFLKHHAIYRFWPDLSMVKNHLKINNPRIQIQIRIFTKIETILPCHTSNTGELVATANYPLTKDCTAIYTASDIDSSQKS